MDQTKEDVLLRVSHLSTSFLADKTVLRAVEDVSFSVRRGETLGIVGESGCGKSVSSMSILRLVQGSVRYDGGEILFDGADTLKMSEKELRKIRGKEIAVIFQEPMTALNPLYTIGDQMSEALRLHNEKLSKKAAMGRCAEYLEKVRIPNPREALFRYPFSLSGGMRQRVMIAMALITSPKLVIADEPTTALDVTIQAQVLELMKELQREVGCSYIFITHDLGVISEMADRVVVMYGGRVCECAEADTLFQHPSHPYTQGLIASRPRWGETAARLAVIPGSVPSLNNKPSGCPFHPRCPDATDRCAQLFPGETDLGGGHTVACWKFTEK